MVERERLRMETPVMSMRVASREKSLVDREQGVIAGMNTPDGGEAQGHRAGARHRGCPRFAVVSRERPFYRDPRRIRVRSGQRVRVDRPCHHGDRDRCRRNR